jgi:UPF0716 family protein affecting phage T7 exclusion
MKLKKVGYPNFISHIIAILFLIPLCEAVLQALVPKQLSFNKKVAHEAILQKNRLYGEAELCQTGPKTLKYLCIVLLIIMLSFEFL